MLIEPEIEEYIEVHSTDVDTVLQQNFRETHLTTYCPQMLSGQVQAKFLEMICRMLQPERVLEIGTFTAYSAIAMTKGKPDNETLGIRRFNNHVKNDKRVEQVMLSVRDGLLLVRKLQVGKPGTGN